MTPPTQIGKLKGFLAKESAPLPSSAREKVQPASRIAQPRSVPRHPAQDTSARSSCAHGRGSTSSRRKPGAAVVAARAASPLPWRRGTNVSLPALQLLLGLRAPGWLGGRPQEATEVWIVLLFAPK